MSEPFSGDNLSGTEVGGRRDSVYWAVPIKSSKAKIKVTGWYMKAGSNGGEGYVFASTTPPSDTADGLMIRTTNGTNLGSSDSGYLEFDIANIAGNLYVGFAAPTYPRGDDSLKWFFIRSLVVEFY